MEVTLEILRLLDKSNNSKVFTEIPEKRGRFQLIRSDYLDFLSIDHLFRETVLFL